MSSCIVYGALPPFAVHLPSFFFQPASVEQLGRRLGVERDRRGGLGVERPRPGRDQRVRAETLPTQRPVHDRLPVDGPEERLAHPRVAQLGMARAQVEQDGRERRRRVLDAGHRGIRGQGAGDGRGRPATPSTAPELNASAAAASSSKKSSSMRSRYGSGELWCPSRSGRAQGVHRWRGPQRDVAAAALHQGDRREQRVGVVELAERIRPGADRRLGERALREVREGHVRQEMRGKQRLRGRRRGSRRSAWPPSARPSWGRRRSR